MENSIGIVILNFNVYEETIKCVSSIRGVIEGYYQIVIVDNGSSNDSFEYLKAYYKKWIGIDVIKNKKNVGFAKGNNVGIRYLKDKYGVKFVFLLNSDTLFTDKDYFKKLIGKYQKGVGVIEANVLNGRGDFAQPSLEGVSVLACLHRFLRALCKYFDIYWLFGEWKTKKKYLCQTGCAIMLTPDYFAVYQGLYSYTFLYGEEHILLILLDRAGLGLEFVEDTYIIHKEGRSTSSFMLEHSREKERRVLKGYWNVFLASCMPAGVLAKATRRKER